MVRAEISGHVKQIIVDFVRNESVTIHNSGSTRVTSLNISDRKERVQQIDHEQLVYLHFVLL